MVVTANVWDCNPFPMTNTVMGANQGWFSTLERASAGKTDGLMVTAFGCEQQLAFDTWPDQE